MNSMQSLRYMFRRQLTDMKRSNEQAQIVVDRLNKINVDMATCKRYIRQLNSLYEGLQTKNANFIAGIIEMLREAVTYAVNSSLPLKKYGVDLDYKPYRNDGVLKLYLIDEDGNRLPPRIVEGDMLNQVLSFSAVTYISVSMGYDTIYYDEAFASANVRSLNLIRAVIRHYIDKGIKFRMVTQNPILYAGIPRTMCELMSDGRQVIGVQLTKVEPDESEEDIVSQVTELFDHITHSKMEG
jgi:hypothetical protein